MRLPVTMTVFVSVLLVGAVVWAEVDPVTLENIPEGEKYTKRMAAEMIAKQATTADEQNQVDAVVQARAVYVKSLEELREYYKSQGNAMGLRKAEAEIEDIKNARQFVFIHWEDKLPALRATEDVAEANALLAEADKLLKAKNPFKRKENKEKAIALYQEILQKHPTSTAVDSAAFGLGEAHASSSIGKYRRAVRFYELCYLANPKTQNDSLYRAAQVCDKDLTDYENAARYYWMASRLGQSVVSRRMAKTRLAQLKSKGFGVTYGDPKPEKSKKEK